MQCFFWKSIYNSQHSHCRCLTDFQWGSAGVGAGLLAGGSLVGKATAGRAVPEGSGCRAGEPCWQGQSGCRKLAQCALHPQPAQLEPQGHPWAHLHLSVLPKAIDKPGTLAPISQSSPKLLTEINGVFMGAPLSVSTLFSLSCGIYLKVGSWANQSRSFLRTASSGVPHL